MDRRNGDVRGLVLTLVQMGIFPLLLVFFTVS